MEERGLGRPGAGASGSGGRKHRPRDVGRKFAANGRVLPFAGNTILCHLPQQGEQSVAFDGLLDIYRAMLADGWMRKISALPPSSYHMTIFEGASDRERHYPYWPAGLPLDMEMARCDELLAERLRNFDLGSDIPPYIMRVDMAEPAVAETPFAIGLVAADDRTERSLRRLRDRLSLTLGIRHPHHDRYRFHVTLGYQFAPLTETELEGYRRRLARWRIQLAKQAPVITFGAPEFCRFGDMFAFKRQFFLR